MDNYWIWWILAAVLIGAEMLTGTFYLLAVGIAFTLGGVVAWVGASLPMQLLTAGVLSVIGTVISSSLVAYGFAKINFRGRGVLFAIMLSTMMIPFCFITSVPSKLLRPRSASRRA